MLRRFTLPVLLVLLLALTGCTTTPPPAPHASPAAALPAALPPASIRGSQESSTLLDHFTAFISAVDGRPVASGRKGWDQPLPLPAGKRRLTVEFVRGAFFARAELEFEAKSEAAYELRHASDAQVYGAHTFCEFWIVDLATGEKATAPKRAELGKVKSGG